MNPTCFEQIGLVVISHGSRDPAAISEFQSLIQLVKKTHPGIVEHGYLEFESPTIGEAIDHAYARLIEANKTSPEKPISLVVLPLMLTAARHVKEDIPKEIQKARHRYPHLPIYYAKHLGFHPKILQLCQIRIEQALLDLPGLNRKETVLIVVGRGTSHADANQEVQRLTASLGERLGLADGIGCYADIVSPLLPEAFEMACGRSFTKFILFPYFIFTGHLVKKVQEEAEQFQEAHQDCLVKVAKYLGPDSLVCDGLIDLFLQRHL